MSSLFYRGVIFFCILLVATTIMVDAFHMQFGTVNYFEKHGLFFLFAVAVFPRLTLLFSSVVSGGFLWWLGFIFCPRILVATLATVAYFHTNPILVTLSWVIAFGGEAAEKWGIGNQRSRFVFRTYRAGGFQPPSQDEPRPQTVIEKDGAIEAEFRKD